MMGLSSNSTWHTIHRRTNVLCFLPRFHKSSTRKAAESPRTKCLAWKKTSILSHPNNSAPKPKTMVLVLETYLKKTNCELIHASSQLPLQKSSTHLPIYQQKNNSLNSISYHPKRLRLSFRRSTCGSPWALPKWSFRASRLKIVVSSKTETCLVCKYKYIYIIYMYLNICIYIYAYMYICSDLCTISIN